MPHFVIKPQGHSFEAVVRLCLPLMLYSPTLFLVDATQMATLLGKSLLFYSNVEGGEVTRP